MGIGILLYPTLSNQYNKLHSSRAVASYQSEVSNYRQDEYDQMMAEARTYNQNLSGYQAEEGATAIPLDYNDCLNLRSGMMGYIEISKIGVSLPIYHGTTENVLQKAVGHLDWTSLPTGDFSNHTVLTGHTGLPSAELFTDVDQLVPGDQFLLHILNEEFVYEVTEINVVEPHEVNALRREPARDLVTLVTCTPYGINSHRLLVTGERQFFSDYQPQIWEEGTDYVGAVLLAVMLMIGGAIFLVFYLERRKRAWENWNAWVAANGDPSESENAQQWQAPGQGENPSQWQEPQQWQASGQGRGFVQQQNPVQVEEPLQQQENLQQQEPLQDAPPRQRRDPNQRREARQRREPLPEQDPAGQQDPNQGAQDGDPEDPSSRTRPPRRPRPPQG